MLKLCCAKLASYWYVLSLLWLYIQSFDGGLDGVSLWWPEPGVVLNSSLRDPGQIGLTIDRKIEYGLFFQENTRVPITFD
jgi:hypothetical protein